VDRQNGGLRFEVNDRPVFVRGACWTATDMRSLDGTAESLKEILNLARDAGLNMLRVGGTMTYASDDLLEACDELGILVWQDFMFANLDYPFDDPGFRSEVEAEVTHQLRRLSRHACLAAWCGGSEVEQQAAMMGLPADACCPPFLSGVLSEMCEAESEGLPYFSSTPMGGALPFHTATGITHYYGVGAYRRPLSDARLAGVRFTSECLGFSNVPEAESMDAILGGARPVPHHPSWKAGVPRDQGAGWDFEDIRDHYLGLFFGLDPVALRSTDLERYWALSRLVTGEAMHRVFAEWRRPGSPCGGGLVWFCKDLRPGAGWGILDSSSRPKASYWALKRTWSSRAVLFTDEGLDGLDLHVLNESEETFDVIVELECLQDGRTRTAFSATSLQLPPFSAKTMQGDALLGRFTDLTHAYRFGPPKHDIVIARLRNPVSGEALHEDVYFPQGMNLPLQHGATVELAAHAEAPGRIALTLRSDVFLQAVALECATDRPNDNHFHLAPGLSRTVLFRADPGLGGEFKVHVSAVNLRETWTVRCQRAG
jgi:beta-mannosidase